MKVAISIRPLGNKKAPKEARGSSPALKGDALIGFE